MGKTSELNDKVIKLSKSCETVPLMGQSHKQVLKIMT
jgi:hypothetical protein